MPRPRGVKLLRRYSIHHLIKKPADYSKLLFEAEKLYNEEEKVAHSRWWQEDTLVNNRLTWLLASQVILFAAFGALALPKPGSVDGNCVNASYHEASALISILPELGLSICISIALGIRAAWRAQSFLKKDYEQANITVGVHDITNYGGRIPGHLLPFIFVLAWGWLFGCQVDLANLVSLNELKGFSGLEGLKSLVGLVSFLILYVVSLRFIEDFAEMEHFTKNNGTCKTRGRTGDLTKMP